MLFGISLLMLVMIAYAVLIIWALPKLVLKTNYPTTKPTDRGLKKYKLSDSDYAIVFEPSLAVRKYITQYVLAKKEGKKWFKCKIAPGVTFLDFDILLFDAQQNCFAAINSMDISHNGGIPDEIELPLETAYASIFINQIDDRVINNRRTAHVSGIRLVMFGLLALLTSIGLSVGSLYAFSNMFGGLFRETFVQEMISTGWIFILPTIISAVCIIMACYSLFLKSNKR